MQTLKRLGIWLLCGFALVVGGYLGLVVLGLEPTSMPNDYVEYPKDLTIHDLKPSPITDHLTVVGKISNASNISMFVSGRKALYTLGLLIVIFPIPSKNSNLISV